ncbi:rod shape-determining protein RodA [Thermosediminibacter oceani]|uniref:Peptidoglycan glycosyltransferase RodA n=1 Tax=Thermosediminibacter oceani (strain ATCC BAA-1034 / DSM 16646 / JW/IW-1228P) TaxID=555079 RepID=D9S286_THEOJ|nr:rod shape-determining protein RodA [Thermosediminibacter oceani]ADL07513.1 cell elongation-specific peptidoglycan biosynthesis regulator RodA [Thermosediminibacter oceani DSM 16646]
MEPKLLKNLEYQIIIVIVLIAALSILTISSATHATAPGGSFHYTKMQFIWFLLGLLMMAAVLMMDYHTIAMLSNAIYIVNLVMLLVVLFMGKTTMGAQRWIPIGPFSFQPSEFSKLAVIITLAKYLDKKKTINSLKDLILVFVHVGTPMLLIMKQPDLGTSLVLLAIMFGMIFVAGTNPRLLLGTIAAGVASLPVLWQFLHDYQEMRILIFLNPNLDPLGYGYHVIQSKIAIGSGRFLGKGLFQGTQNQLDFIPEQQTDFIFAVLGEELGFIGGMFLLILFFTLIYRTIRIAFRSRDVLGTYMATGVASMWAFQVLVNVGMTMGLMPVTGIPLPFMSYGGSSLLMNMMAVGLVLNIGMRRQKILF